MEPEVRHRYLKTLPAVDELLHHPKIQLLLKIHPQALVVEFIRKVVGRKRQAILQSSDEEEAACVGMTQEEWIAAVEAELTEAFKPLDPRQQKAHLQTILSPVRVYNDGRIEL